MSDPTFDEFTKFRNAQDTYDKAIELQKKVLGHIKSLRISSFNKAEEVRTDITSFFLTLNDLYQYEGYHFELRTIDNDNSRFKVDHLAKLRQNAMDTISFSQRTLSTIVSERLNMFLGVITLIAFFTTILFQLKTELIGNFGTFWYFVLVFFSILSSIVFGEVVIAHFSRLSRLISKHLSP